MINNKQVAQEISHLMLKIGGELDFSLLQVQKNCTDDEFIRYRTAIGNDFIGYSKPFICRTPIYKA